MLKNIRKLRGTALFDEFEAALPEFNNLDDCGEYEFYRAIELLQQHYKTTVEPLANNRLSQLRQPIARLRQLHAEYQSRNARIASAIFVVMANVEAYYLKDQDGKLVYRLTKLYLDGAKAKARSPLAESGSTNLAAVDSQMTPINET